MHLGCVCYSLEVDAKQQNADIKVKWVFSFVYFRPPYLLTATLCIFRLALNEAQT